MRINTSNEIMCRLDCTAQCKTWQIHYSESTLYSHLYFHDVNSGSDNFSFLLLNAQILLICHIHSVLQGVWQMVVYFPVQLKSIRLGFV